MSNTGAAALRGLWLAVILLAGLVAAVLSGVIFWLVGAGLAAALAAGGATFVGVASLGIAMRKFIVGEPG
jgi:hypothetical protein